MDEPNLEDIEEDQANGGYSLSAQVNDMVHKQWEEVVSGVLADQYSRPIPTCFVRNDSIRMVNQLNDDTSYITRLPYEVLEKIIYQVLSSSGFS